MISTQNISLNFDLLLKLRLVVARHGEMDNAKWWNTNGLLSRKGALLMSRGFPKTHRFAQAKVLFAVARTRCLEVFDPPACVTLWKLPAEIEDGFDACWNRWLDEREKWEEFFDSLQQLPSENLLESLAHFKLIEKEQLDTVSRLRRSAENRAVPLSGVFDVEDETMTLLAGAFVRGEVGKLAVPYARLA